MIHSMMKATFGILLIVLCQQMNAQTITGKVTDERKQPLDAALVWFVTPANDRTVAQVITNTDGYFSLPCIDKEASNDFHYTEAILAGYLQYDAGLSDKWQVNVGLRMEYTRSKEYLIPVSGSSQQENKVKRDYVDFFPSAGITYNLNEDNTLSLSYGRRIDRPVYSDLNPIDQPLDGFSSWKGNPFLEPQKTNRLSLQFRHKKTSAELSYSVTTDYRVSITDTLGTDKTVTIPRNLGKQTYYGLALSQALRLFRVCDVYFSGRAYHLDNRMAFDETRFYHRKRWAYGVSLQASFPLVWGIRSEVLGIYSSKRLGALRR